MSKKKNKLSLIQKAQNKFKKFKSMDLDYRTILSEALALIYKIHKSVSDDELENECKKANLNYNQERKHYLKSKNAKKAKTLTKSHLDSIIYTVYHLYRKSI